MARKFNIGRQGEQLLNEEWHNLFMSLKYLNYNRYLDFDESHIGPERQTNIPDHALKLQQDKYGVDILKAFYPTLGTAGEWKPVFENYYHPANSMKPSGNDFVAYRLCINPNTGAIEYWDPSENRWRVARAQEYNGADNSFNGLNFQFISNLEKIDLDYYPVPYVNYGRLFSKQNPAFETSETEVKGRYVNISDYNPETGEIIDNNYASVNGCAIKLIDQSHTDLSWVHVNASKVARIDKRLIEVPDDGYINISPTQTEFYGFKADNENAEGCSRLGTLLIKGENEEDLLNGSDYIGVMGGIQLSEDICQSKRYNFIYAITYVFDDYPGYEGYVTVGMGAVGGDYQVYIGGVEAPIALFLDGLALEETNEFGETIYTYEATEGTLTFADEEDAEIINDMQMAVLAFANKSEEFVLEKSAANVVVKEDSVCVTVDVKSTESKGSSIPGYARPMVFCSGLGLQETTIFEDFTVNDVNGSKVTIEIKGLKLPGEAVKGFIADIGDSFVGKGKLYDGKTSEHELIVEDNDYIMFVNGLLLTSTNGDMIVRDGYIEVVNSKNISDSLLEYIIFRINDDDKNVALIFDDTVSYFSLRIDDGGDKSVYNNCNSAIVYVQNGIILDKAAIDKPINTLEGYYKGNQIVRVLSEDNERYKYYKYDFTQDEPEEIVDQDKIDLIERLIGYYSTSGSIHLIGDDVNAWQGCSMSYYAYSYANMIDEPMIHGRRDNLPIPVKDDDLLYTYRGTSNIRDTWNKNCQALSTYINGLIIENEEIDDDADGLVKDYNIKYPKFDIKTDKEYYGDIDLAHVLKQMYDIYKGIKDSKDELKSFSSKFEVLLSGESIMEWDLDGKVVRNLFPTELLAEEALKLAIYIHEDMQHESTSYLIERLERNEFQSAYRDFINLEQGYGNKHSQILGTINDTVETDFNLAPGVVNVYQNGVLLQPNEYCRFNNNKIMFNVDVCGLQQLPEIDTMIRSIPNHISEEMKYELENVLYKKDSILRIIEDTAYYIPTSNRDTILIEKRDDTSIRTATYDILDISYNTQEFSQDFYDIPDSLIDTGDYIKIYINGVRYEGEYELSRKGGVKGIKLLEPNFLVIDPILTHFSMNPIDAIEYKNTHNHEYKRQIDKITFEWR